MKKVLFYASMLTLALSSCTSTDDESVVEGIWTDPVNAASAVESMFAQFGNSGSMTVSTAASSRFAAPMSRVIGDYATPSTFASKAGAVANPYSVQAAPSVPADALDLNDIQYYNNDKTLQSGKVYVINSNDYNLGYQRKWAEGDNEGTIDVYIAPGVILNGNPNIDYGSSRVKYYICEGATWNCTTNPLEIHNWGTLNLTNGISQAKEAQSPVDWQNHPITQKLMNYGELNCSGTVQIEGVMYSSTDVKALLKGAGEVYVEGNLVAESGFGLGGKLYVAGEMSGDININTGLAAHVGSINTTDQVTVTASSQLMVEGDVKAASMKPDGDSWPNGVSTPSEIVIKGKADIAGEVYVASGTKGYIEILECENYTANASDIWVGCKSDVRKKFELNGNAFFTLANGVYLHAGEANFAANTKMTLMSKAYFKVDGKLQLNNANTNELNGSGSELAIVKAATMGANYENFENTFTGNIGVEFEAWDYNSSTGLIDQNVNLKRMSDLADAFTIAKSDCNPGFTGSKVKPTDPTPDPDPDPDPDPNPDPDPDPDPDPTPDPDPEIPFDGCDLVINLPLDVKGEWIVQADDFAIHFEKGHLENIANSKEQHETVRKYIVVDPQSNVTISLNDLCAMYEEYKNKTKTCDDVNSAGVPCDDFGQELRYIGDDGILTLEVYLWPGKRVEVSDGVNSFYKIVPIPATEFGVADDGIAGKYIIGSYEQTGTDPVTGKPIYEGKYENYGNDKYNVKVQAYMSYNGGGNGADMTSYVKVSFHISPKQ